MFLHLGGEVSVLQKEIIGIFDVESVQGSQITKEFLEVAKSEARIIQMPGNQKLKSFIICGEKIYYSPISSLTLQRRAFNIQSIGDDEKEE